MPQPEDHWICDLIKGADPVFTTLFTAEMLLKWWGLGLWQYQHSYFRDAWNWLDFVIVVEGLFSTFTAGTGVNFQGLRTFRVLRPLRTITHLEGACVGWVACVRWRVAGPYACPYSQRLLCTAPPPSLGSSQACVWSSTRCFFRCRFWSIRCWCACSTS